MWAIQRAVHAKEFQPQYRRNGRLRVLYVSVLTECPRGMRRVEKLPSVIEEVQTYGVRSTYLNLCGVQYLP